MMGIGSTIEVSALAIGAALFWGFEPAFSKRGLDGAGTWMQNTLVVLGTRTALYWVLLVVTGGAAALTGITAETVVLFALSGVVASGLGRLLFYVAVDEIGSAITNAFTNTRPLFAVGLAVVLLGEDVTVLMAIGTLVIVAGLVVMTLSEGGDIEGWDRRYLALPLLTATFFALGNIIRRFGFTTATIEPLQAIAIANLAAFIFVSGTAVVSDNHDLHGSRESYAYFTVSGLFAGMGLLLVFQALSLDGGHVAIVDPLTATAPLFTTVFAAAFLRDVERVTLGTVVGVLVAIAGVVLVTAG
ncbi:DMT family transporter [Halorientalis halophila]|uniref:DMT family transporter n=1 Tax=Halorientalis halophila TaxID=3108499 RepID=UPI00300B3FE4